MGAQPCFPGLFTPAPKAHKAARQTSRECYRRKRAQDIQAAEQGRETRRGAALRFLAWHWNVRQTSPTASELFVWASERGATWRHVAELRPRLHELYRLGLIEPLPARRCAVTRETARAWRVREAGSGEAR